MTSAVSVQITIVSVNTSKDPEKSLFYRFSGVCTGMCDGTGTKTCLIGKKIPLETPFFILMKKLPTTPPVTDAGLNAL